MEGEHGVDPANYEFRPTARRFELGTTAVAPYAGLEAAIETVQAVGLERIDGRIDRLAGRLKGGWATGW